jgi:CheY-like chemotaxis protein
VPGEHVCLSVTDTGCGMPPEIIDKIFEPFFTTKEQGKGTGLGLATSYGIVQQHGGWMECESAPGHGTTFRVFLPRNETVAPIEVAPATPAAPTDVRGDETILLVDDEIMVRMVAETLLKSHGYRILTAGDGQEAVSVFRAHQDEISLILMDMTMPKMSGLEAFQELRTLDRFTPVVICSGYVVDLGEWQTPQGDRPNGFVQKPYNLRDLVSTVRHLIDTSAERSSQSRHRSPQTASLAS